MFISYDGNTVAVIGDNEISYEGYAFYADEDGIYFWDYENEIMECREYNQ